MKNGGNAACCNASRTLKDIGDAPPHLDWPAKRHCKATGELGKRGNSGAVRLIIPLSLGGATQYAIARYVYFGRKAIKLVASPYHVMELSLRSLAQRLQG
jgi:hypothetical protein